MIWYDLHPSGYAKGLRYNAERADERVKRYLAEGKPWSAQEAEKSARTARRLRAMAILCDKSTATRAGDIDFLGLHDPSLSRGDEDAAIAKIEQMEG